jgi:hypothetical protein
LNEPFAGNYFKNPQVLANGYVDQKYTETEVYSFAYKWNRNGKENDVGFSASEDFHYPNGVTLKLEGCDECVLERTAKNYYKIKYSQHSGERLIKARISPQ